MTRHMLLGLLLSCSLSNAYAFRDIKPMTDAEIRANILNSSIKSYEGECPCPFSNDKKGKTCGENSEYFRSRGRVLCYERDIQDSEVATYRQKYSITDPRFDPHGRLDFGITKESQENNTSSPPTSPETRSGNAPANPNEFKP